MLSKRTNPRIFVALLGLLLLVAAGVPATAQGTPPAENGVLIYSYAVKFVCGFNSTNTGQVIDPDGVTVSAGEPTVKAGNYATDINIFNPSNDAFVQKKVLLLNKGGQPLGREPKFVEPSAYDEIALPTCSATMDDCNRIAQLLFPAGVPTPLPLLVGFLVLQSSAELDVTAVYTAEMCSDWTVVGGQNMCSNPPANPGFAGWGAGISIDVEQIEGKLVKQ